MRCRFFWYLFARLNLEWTSYANYYNEHINKKEYEKNSDH